MSHELDRFMNSVRVRLPGALDDAVKLEMFSVLDEFCKETNAWQEVIPLSTTSQHTVYEIEPEENRAVIVRLLYTTMIVNGETSLPGVVAWMPQPDQIVFKYPPSDGTDYSATVALTVTDPTNPDDLLPEFPDWFLTNYSDSLLDGVLSKMMSQAAKPYFSQQGFLYHGRRFRNSMSRIRSAVEVGHTYGTQVWRFPFFAGR